MQRGFLGPSGGGSNHKKKRDRNIDGVARGPRLNPSIADVNVEVVSEAPHHRNIVVVSAQDATKTVMGDVLNQANLWKMDSNVPNDADYDVWLSLASVHEVNDRMKNSFYGYFIGKRLTFLVVEWFVRNNWNKYGLTKVTMVKGFFFFKFSSLEGVDSMLHGGSWTICGILIFLYKLSPSVSLLKEELSRVLVWVKFYDVFYARVLIEINACNDFSDNLVMVVPNLEVTRYTKETIHKGQTFGAVDDDFIEVKKKKSSGNNGGTKNFKSVSLKPKTQYRPKAKKSTEGTSNSPKTTPFVGTNTASTSRYNKESPSNKCSVFSLSNSFETLDVDNSINEEVATSSKATTSEKVDYPVNSNSGDEVEPVENETANFLASKRVGYGPKSL
uniref:DUF4283 domain-containing protein n=1 Tax=Tanacetum cinerariifolium TaxID=118510 RepID=A0A699ISJ9_TANCI|nr:hypothetical protein [Tanacetum cinerariifolium]